MPRAYARWWCTFIRDDDSSTLDEVTDDVEQWRLTLGADRKSDPRTMLPGAHGELIMSNRGEHRYVPGASSRYSAIELRRPFPVAWSLHDSDTNAEIRAWAGTGAVVKDDPDHDTMAIQLWGPLRPIGETIYELSIREGHSVAQVAAAFAGLWGVDLPDSGNTYSTLASTKAIEDSYRGRQLARALATLSQGYIWETVGGELGMVTRTSVSEASADVTLNTSTHMLTRFAAHPAPATVRNRYVIGTGEDQRVHEDESSIATWGTRETRAPDWTSADTIYTSELATTASPDLTASIGIPLVQDTSTQLDDVTVAPGDVVGVTESSGRVTRMWVLSASYVALRNAIPKLRIEGPAVAGRATDTSGIWTIGKSTLGGSDYIG